MDRERHLYWRSAYRRVPTKAQSRLVGIERTTRYRVPGLSAASGGAVTDGLSQRMV